MEKRLENCSLSIINLYLSPHRCFLFQDYSQMKLSYQHSRFLSATPTLMENFELAYEELLASHDGYSELSADFEAALSSTESHFSDVSSLLNSFQTATEGSTVDEEFLERADNISSAINDTYSLALSSFLASKMVRADISRNGNVLCTKVQVHMHQFMIAKARYGKGLNCCMSFCGCRAPLPRWILLLREKSSLHWCTSRSHSPLTRSSCHTSPSLLRRHSVTSMELTGGNDCGKSGFNHGFHSNPGSMTTMINRVAYLHRTEEALDGLRSEIDDVLDLTTAYGMFYSK